MRRFEFIQGNEAKFWEVVRRGGTLTMVSGKIGGNAKSRTKSLDDYMAAEQEFDRLIRDKLRRGYVEVQAASEAPLADPQRALTLRLCKGKGELNLSATATKYLVWRMVEVGVMDRQAEGPNLERWAVRAARRLRHEHRPDPGAEGYDAYREMYLGLSKTDRAATCSSGLVGGFKFLSGSDWIVTPAEAGVLAEASSARTPRRHKASAIQEKTLAEWADFNTKATKGGGYVVEVVES